MAAIFQDGRHFENIPLMALKRIFVYGTISNLCHKHKNYPHAKIGALNANWTIEAHFKMAAIFQDGRHFENIPLMALKHIFRDGTISNLFHWHKNYPHAKFGAFNKKWTIEAHNCLTITAKFQ